MPKTFAPAIGPATGQATTLPFSATHGLSAECTGLVLGMRVPIVLTSRSDSVASRVASCALAVLMSRGPVASRSARHKEAA